MPSIWIFFAIVGAVLLFISLIWLHVRGFKDAAFADPLLFLTGISLVSYICARWDRAKGPLFLGLCGLACLFCFRMARIDNSVAEPVHLVVQNTIDGSGPPKAEKSDRDAMLQLPVKTTDEPYSDDHVAKIILKRDGKIILDGDELSVTQLEESLDKRKSELKSIWYHREGHEDDSGPKNIERVLNVITKYHLPIAIYWDSEFTKRVVLPE
jgi:hypothetical protein